MSGSPTGDSTLTVRDNACLTCHANTPAQDRTQLGIAELVNGAVVPNRRVDYLHGLAFEAIGDLLERPPHPCLSSIAHSTSFSARGG